MDSTVAAGTGIFGIILFGFFVILAVLAILMPFFVYRIRNEIIEANEKLSQAVQCLQDLVALEGGKTQRWPIDREEETL